MDNKEKKLPKDVAKIIHKWSQEQKWEESRLGHFIRSSIFKLGFSKCRYCIYFEPEDGDHKSIRESAILTQGRCKWTKIPEVILTKKEASKFYRCGAFIPILYNIEGYSVSYDEVKDILSRRQNYFFSWATILVAIIAATIAWTQTVETRKERIKAEEVQKSVKEVANTILRISHIIADGSGRFGGIPQVHLDAIKKYQKSIEKYLDKNLEQEIKREIQELNSAIEEQNKKNP